MPKKMLLIFSILLIFVFSLNVSASQIEIGGELETYYNIIFSKNENPSFSLVENLNLKLYLPESNKAEAKVDFDITNTQTGIKTNFKKLYLKKKFSNFNLTLGRQPVSWSFGSLINPVDFNFGAEVMDESTSAKYIDAAKFYFPVNWKTGIEIVTEPKYSKVYNKDINEYIYDYQNSKIGLRGRTMFNNYDLSTNYVYDSAKAIENRIGFSIKGDLGFLGAYSAFSYEKDDDSILEDEKIYLVGLDYSKTVNYSQRIYLQGEIINLSGNKLINMVKNMPTSSQTNVESYNLVDDRYNLFLGNISYTINDFSNLNFMMMANINDGSLVLLPQYKNQLPGNIDLIISSSLAGGDKGEVFYNSNIPLSVSLSYSF